MYTEIWFPLESILLFCGVGWLPSDKIFLWRFGISPAHSPSETKTTQDLLEFFQSTFTFIIQSLVKNIWFNKYYPLAKKTTDWWNMQKYLELFTLVACFSSSTNFFNFVAFKTFTAHLKPTNDFTIILTRVIEDCDIL